MRVFGSIEDFEVMDSNELQEGWREKIRSRNPNTKYRWEMENETLREQESHLHNNIQEENEEANVTDENLNFSSEECPENEPVHDQPKRVLAFSSSKLLKLFAKNLKSSVDGTFKSACTHWKQNFTWMLKISGHWIPVVHGWLPDKSEASYKVRCFYISKLHIILRTSSFIVF